MSKFDLLLFIDDDLLTNTFHEMVVNNAGLSMQNRFFSDPLEGIEYFRQYRNKNFVNPDVLFLDINMPKMNG